MGISRYSQPIQAQYIPTSVNPQMQMALLQKREQDQQRLDQTMNTFESTLAGINAYGDEDSKLLQQKQQEYQKEMSSLYDKYGQDPNLMLRASKDLNKRFGLDVQSGDLSNISRRYNIAQETIKDAQERFGKGELTPEAYQWQLQNATQGVRAQKDPGIYKEFAAQIGSHDYSNDMFGGDPTKAMDNAVNAWIKQNEVQLSYMDEAGQAAAIDNARRIFANKWIGDGNSMATNTVKERRVGMQSGYENKPFIDASEQSFDKNGRLRTEYVFGKDGVNYPQTYKEEDSYLADVRRQLDDNRAVYNIPDSYTDKEALEIINSYHAKNANNWTRAYNIQESSKVDSLIPKLADENGKMILDGSEVWINGEPMAASEVYKYLYKESGAESEAEFMKMLGNSKAEILAAGKDSGSLHYIFQTADNEPIDIEVSNPDENVKALMQSSYNLTKAVASGEAGQIPGVVGQIAETGQFYESVEIAHEWNEETKQPEIKIYPLDKNGYRIVYKEGKHKGEAIDLDLDQIANAERDELASVYADRKKK